VGHRHLINGICERNFPALVIKGIGFESIHLLIDISTENLQCFEECLGFTTSLIYDRFIDRDIPDPQLPGLFAAVL
jgi:hypothetical protein